MAGLKASAVGERIVQPNPNRRFQGVGAAGSKLFLEGYQVKSVRLGIGKRKGRRISSELTYLPIPSKGCKHWRYGTSAISQGGRRLILLLKAVSYTHLRAHETRHDLVCRL